MVIKQQPELKRCLTRCRHCQILFFTHPRNKGRNDLRCPFGCRQARRRQKSTERSVAYYRSKEGKFKKAELNKQRNQKEICAWATDSSVGSKVEAGPNDFFPPSGSHQLHRRPPGGFKHHQDPGFETFETTPHRFEGKYVLSVSCASVTGPDDQTNQNLCSDIEQNGSHNRISHDSD